MASSLKRYQQLFDAQTLRERGLIGVSVIVAIGFLWWINYATPMMAQIEQVQTDNEQLQREVSDTQKIIRDIRTRIAGGVHRDKEAQLSALAGELGLLEEKLRVTTIELIDPEKMFELMNQLIYRDSQLKLLSLQRREVKPALPPLNEEDAAQEPGIYRHVLEIRFAGSYLDILKYMQSLEGLDWKLLWDEIEIESGEYPLATVKVVISTMSTRKEWVGI